jgi:carbamoyltransferase
LYADGLRKLEGNGDEMNILGLNCVYHEDSASLISNGQLVACVEQERLSRRRHTKFSTIDNADQVPFEAIDLVLKMAGLTFSDVDLVGSSLDPVLRLLRNTAYQSPYPVPEGDWGSRSGELTYFSHAAAIPKRLEERYGVSVVDKYLPLQHHLCHGASAFYASPFEEAAVLVVDGIGEFSSLWLGYGNRDGLKPLLNVKFPDFPNSLGIWWDWVVEFLGWHPYASAHLMALAPYGKPSSLIDKLLSAVSDADPEEGFFKVNTDVFPFRAELPKNSGLASITNSPSEEGMQNHLGIKPRHEPGYLPEHMDLAFAAQRVLEHHLLRMVRHLREQTGMENLCYAGGVGLNCVANFEIATQAGFKRVYVQPAANDAGTSLGAAYLIDHEVLGHDRLPPMEHAFWGPQYGEDEIKVALKSANLSFERKEDIAQVVATEVAAGRVVGWFQGPMEWGPRALGSRSLLADPRRGEMRKRLNEVVKIREWFRPYCPSVLEEDARDWFVVPDSVMDMTPFMLVACPVKDNRREKIPAVIHVDGSARVQIVKRETNPLYHQLLTAFKKQTRVPLVLNTSFNESEPIVCTPADAITTCLHTRIDSLAIGPFLVRFH